ncbi:MAG: hypothetical protein LH609_12905 [Rudanella sp.]|nr:hypothetical protein [Rudanella sp.]
MNRQQFLMITGGAIVVGGVTYYLLNDKLNATAAASQQTDISKLKLTPDEREMLSLATLAPSGHNTQPWKFSVEPNTIRIYPDFTRRVPAVDPDDRELWISLGGVLENLLIAAQHAGYETETDYMLDGTAEDHIAVRLKKAGIRPDSQSVLFGAIPLRQCTRNEYDQKPVPTADLNKLETAATGAGVTPMLFTGAAAIEPMLEYVNAGNDRQMTDDAFKSELTEWIRFSNGEADEKMDGLASRVMGNPSLPRWLAQLFIGIILNPKSENKKDDGFMRSSSGLMLFVSQKNDRAAWIETGRAYERFALLSTAMNIKNAFMNQPCEVPELRAQVQSNLTLNGAFPQLLARFGHSPAMPRSLRRPLSQVLVIKE